MFIVLIAYILRFAINGSNGMFPSNTGTSLGGVPG